VRHIWLLVRRRSKNITRSLVLAVSGATVIYTFVVGVVGELGEQARFRTMTDPLLVTVALAEIVRLVQQRRASHQPHDVDAGR
jgi:hypothetical protein